MQSFIQRYADKVSGVLSGLDRIRFRGTLRRFSNVRGMASFLSEQSILLKDFLKWATGRTDVLKESTERLAEENSMPIRYVQNSSSRKEDLAKSSAGDRWERDGLSCILSCVEPCRTFSIHRNRETKRLDLRYHNAKCLHYYFYLRHPQWGPMHVRLQTWLPFSVHICLNGRDWLATEMTRLKLPHVQRDNTFTYVEDVDGAQRLLDRQLKTNWGVALDRVLESVHPTMRTLFPGPMDYYWSAEETEWATDVMFHSADDLAELYPRLVRHGVFHFRGEDVLRFLGRPGTLRQFKTAHLQSDLKRRHEGVRIKHALNRNSVKMYDKQASVLRIETTINDPRGMKVYRPAEGDSEGPKAWRPLRKGVSDLHRRAKLSQASNERYLDALAVVDDGTPLEQATAAVCRPAELSGRRVRPLQLLAENDARLLEVVNRGEFAINGFRNRDLLPLIEGAKSDDPVVAKRQAAKVTRQLRLLRAHRLIAKVPKTHRYVLTDFGRTIINAVLAARKADTRKLSELAA